MSPTKPDNRHREPRDENTMPTRIASEDAILEQERERRFLAYQDRKREQREQRALGNQTPC